MLPDRVIATQSFEKVLTLGDINIFHELYIPELCKDASNHHSSLTIFYQHSMNYQTVQVDFQFGSFNFYRI